MEKRAPGYSHLTEAQYKKLGGASVHLGGSSKHKALEKAKGGKKKVMNSGVHGSGGPVIVGGIRVQ